MLPEAHHKQISKNHSRKATSSSENIGWFAKQINSAVLRVDATGTNTTVRGTDAIVVYDEVGIDRVEYLNGSLLANRLEFVKQKRS